MADAAPPSAEPEDDPAEVREPSAPPAAPRSESQPEAEVLLGRERLPRPSATPTPGEVTPGGRRRVLVRERDPDPGEITPRSPRAPRVSTPRPSLSGPDLRPIPRASITGPIQASRGAPAAPRPGAGVAYPMPGDDDDIPDAPPPIGARAHKGPSRSYPTAPIGPRTAAPVSLSPRMTAIFGGLFGLATVTSVVALLIQVVPPRNDRAIAAGSASAGAGTGAFEATAAAPGKPAAPAVKKRVRTPIAGPWRLSELEKEPGITVERGQMEKKSLFDALGDKGVPRAEVYRIIKSLDGVRKFDKPKRKDRFAVAFDRAAKKVRAFEYETSPSDVWQARASDAGLLTGAKLDMKVAEEELTGAFYVSQDVAASYRAAGFEDGILAALDEALVGNMSSDGFEEGGTVRVIAVEETALGSFSRYKRVVALEYRPADPAGKPLRMYTFNGAEARGYWNDKGRQPNAGGWRSPIPGAPITSHFNPKRMHPVLHTIMPHTGTDFGGPSGTPIYSAYRGTLENVGPMGPCGNTVVISHPGGITTGYCHMSRFAKVKTGDKVGTHQLIGYVGTTGRSTGPHLHFFVKKDGKFVDSRTLHLDGDRPVPTVDRPAFMAAKAELDRRLDAIPLPDPPPEAAKPAPAAGSASAEPEADAPPGDAKGSSSEKKPKEKGGRRAAQIGSPEALAAARAEPGIHPSQFVEVKGDDDDGPGPAADDQGKGNEKKPKGKPDPAEEEDEEK